MSENEPELTPAHKRKLNRIFLNVVRYLNTPEGMHSYERLVAISASIKARTSPPKPSLTTREEKALAYIKRERSKGRSPSTRGVARAVGLRSSRSGYLVLGQLKSKGVIT